MIASLLVTRLWDRPRNRRTLAAAIGPAGIDEAGFVHVAGIEHFRTVRGAARSNPILVFLHGGPGATQTIFNTATIPWERHVTVVQYDQRGSGKTLQRSGPAHGLTLEQLRDDAVAMIEAVLAEFGGTHVILAGSSVGSAIALMVAASRPDLVSAYLGVDQLASPESRQESHRLTVEALQCFGNRAGLAALAQSDPARLTPASYDKVVRWTLAARPDIPHMVNDVIIPALLTSPLHTTKDARLLDTGMKASANALFEEIGRFDAHRVAPRLEVPVTLVHGSEDLVNPGSCVRSWYDALQAPAKAFVPMERTGHLAAFTRPGEFTDVLAPLAAQLRK